MMISSPHHCVPCGLNHISIGVNSLYPVPLKWCASIANLVLTSLDIIFIFVPSSVSCTSTDIVVNILGVVTARSEYLLGSIFTSPYLQLKYSNSSLISSVLSLLLKLVCGHLIAAEYQCYQCFRFDL